MVFLKIISAVSGIALVFFGFYFVCNRVERKEILGAILAIAGIFIFCLSVLLLFVPEFFE